MTEYKREDLNMEFFPSINPHKDLEIPETWGWIPRASSGVIKQ